MKDLFHPNFPGCELRALLRTAEANLKRLKIEHDQERTNAFREELRCAEIIEQIRATIQEAEKS